MTATIIFILFIVVSLLLLPWGRKFGGKRYRNWYYPVWTFLYAGSVVYLAFLCRTPKPGLVLRMEVLKIYRLAAHCLLKDGTVSANVCNNVLQTRNNVFKISQNAPLQDMVLNIVFFLPLGFLLPFLWKKCTWWKTLILGTLVSCLIEGLQAYTRLGVCDIDDVLNNALGALLGYFLAKWAARLYKGETTQ
ncbi:VanZ family protein [Candidatus Avelusimicrobium sp.]|uniref:VanZ family protein n=1 Tax=Candidatus Avelusimicrobium sp. TaxID=3048833 RepID=UPI003D7C91DE